MISLGISAILSVVRRQQACWLVHSRWLFKRVLHSNTHLNELSQGLRQQEQHEKHITTVTDFLQAKYNIKGQILKTHLLYFILFFRVYLNSVTLINAMLSLGSVKAHSKNIYPECSL